ncbi:MAG: hypothetical protein ABR998_10520 [Gemmatimonadales bacterium]
MTTVFPPDTPAKRASGFQRFAALRQLTKAARLLRRSAISNLDYGVLAIDTISRLTGTPLRREDGWGVVDFTLQAGFAIGAKPHSDDPAQWARYGPFEHAVTWLGAAFPAYQGGGDQYNVQTTVFMWGDNSDRLLRLAKLRMHVTTRLLERADTWRAEQAELAPHLHDDLWKLVWAIVGAIVGFVLGRVTAL